MLALPFAFPVNPTQMQLLATTAKIQKLYEVIGQSRYSELYEEMVLLEVY